MQRIPLIFIFVLSVIFGQCTKKPVYPEAKPDDFFLKVAPLDREQIADKEAQTLLVPVQGNISYRAQSAAVWAKVPAVVEAGESFSIELSENLDSEVRATKVVLSASDLEPVEIWIEQGGVAPFALMAPTVVEIDEELTFMIRVKTNIQYALTIPEWLTLVPATNRALTRTDEYTYRASSTLLPRSGEIKLQGTGENSDIHSKITINQGIDQSIAPRFAVISDVHIRTASADDGYKDTRGTSTGKLEKTLDFLLTKNPEAIFIVGDVTDNGQPAEYTRLKAILDAKVPANIPVYLTTGNHDLYSADPVTKFTATFGVDPNQYFEFKGHPFILVGMNSSGGPYYNNIAKDFLTEKLAAAARDYPNKPIFVFYHVPAQNTVYGSAATAAQGGGWGSNVLNDVMNQYPQAIAFSGHSHFPLGDERSIHQDKFTSINLGSVTYTEFENNGFFGGIGLPNKWQVTEGIMVEPQDNPALKEQRKYYKNYKISRYDTYRLEEIKEPWLITAPYDGTAFPYKGRSGATHSFAAHAAVSTSEITMSSVKIAWSQAVPTNTYDKVHHYEVRTVKSADNSVVQTLKIYSEFYLNSAMPSTLSHTIQGLEFNTSYRVEVRAVDSWYVNRSEPIVSQNFVTEDYIPDPSTVVPVADLFDVAYTNANAVDYSPFQHVITKGTGSVNYTFNSALKQYMGVYTSSDQSYHKLPYTAGGNFANKFTQKFSLEVFYRNTETSVAKNIVSAQQSGGMGLERASGSAGATQLWIHNGSYKQIGKTVTNATDYYHMVFTFDGSKVIAYTNGSKVDELAFAGPLQLPTSVNAHWFAIGGDAHTTDKAEGSMPGDIVFTRMYSEALSQDEVIRLNEQIDRRKTLTKVGDLNTALITTIPNKLSGATGNQRTALENLQAEGWKLMNNLGTTDQKIQTFLNTLSTY